MSDILTIRLPSSEKAEWKRAADDARETVAEYVRQAVRQRTMAGRQSPWAKHLGSVDARVPPPTNANVRHAFAARRMRKT